MHIERINENQIRCTLTHEDLESRGLSLSELAYGTDKARRLFRDMMEQAAVQLDFRVDGMPLMIEAVPMRDSILLIITRVTNPEEFDARLASFAPSIHQEAQTAPDAQTGDDTGFDRLFENIRRKTARLLNEMHPEYTQGPPAPGAAGQDALSVSDGSAGESTGPKEQAPPGGDASPRAGKKKGPQGGQAASPAENRGQGAAPEKREAREEAAVLVYAFDSVLDVMNAAAGISGIFRGESSFYREPDGSRYYLVLRMPRIRSDRAGNGLSILTAVSEHAEPLAMSAARERYLQEHCELIRGTDAVQYLSFRDQ